MHWRSDPQMKQVPLAVRGTGPTVTKIWLAMAAMVVLMWLAALMWA